VGGGRGRTEGACRGRQASKTMGMKEGFYIFREREPTGGTNSGRQHSAASLEGGMGGQEANGVVA